MLRRATVAEKCRARVARFSPIVRIAVTRIGARVTTPDRTICARIEAETVHQVSATLHWSTLTRPRSALQSRPAS